MANPSDDWIGQALANGRYHITGKLGEGGMGSVYRAQDRNIGADVVIKVPLRKMLDDPGFAGRFKDEIRSLVRLSHPHIVKVTDVGEWDGLPFAVMQYLPGGSLEDRRQAEPAEVPRWLTAIAGALDYVHSQGYVHRDVKPGNILFDNQGHAFLGDFGVVKVLASASDAGTTRASLTGAGMLVGTPEYMAPELIMGEPFDGRVDQYALAVTAYEMLGGRRPFEDDVKTKVLVLQTTHAPRSLAEFCTWVPPQLSQAVLRGLAKDPNRRYPHCVALAEAVRAAVEASPPGPAERVRLRCPSCGRKIGLPPHDFVKLRRTGRRVSCPNCQARIEITDALVARPEAAATGHETAGNSTMAFNVQDIASHAADIQPRRTMVEPNRATPTMAEPHESPPGGDPRRANRTVVEPSGLSGAGPRRGNPTIVETSGAPGAGSRPVNPTLIERPGSQDVPEQATIHKAGPAPATWIAAGAAGAVLLVGLLGVIWAMRAPAPGANLAVATPAVVAPALTAAPTPETPPPVATRQPDPPRTDGRLSGPAPRPPETADPGPGPLPPPGPAPGLDVAANPDSNPSPDGGLRPPTGGDAPDAPDGSLGGAMVASTEGPRPYSQGETILPRPETELDAVASTVPTRKGSVKLEEILGDPGLYANQVVLLYQSYCIGDVAARRPDGSLSLPVIESMLDYDPNKRSCVVLRRDSFNLDLDEGLSRQLVRMGRIRVTSGPTGDAPRWESRPAIVTVRVARRGTSAPDEWACRIVKFEFYVRFECSPHAVGYRKKLRVVYHTQTVSARGEELGIGDPEEWSDRGRLGHLDVELQKMFKNLSAQENRARWNQMDAVIGATIRQGVQDAAARQSAGEAARRSALMPRPAGR